MLPQGWCDLPADWRERTDWRAYHTERAKQIGCTYDEEWADEVVGFMQSHKLVKGRWGGQHFKLLPHFEQQAVRTERSFATSVWHLLVLRVKRAFIEFRCARELKKLMRSESHPEFRGGVSDAIHLTSRYLRPCLAEGCVRRRRVGRKRSPPGSGQEQREQRME